MTLIIVVLPIDYEVAVQYTILLYNIYLPLQIPNYIAISILAHAHEGKHLIKSVRYLICRLIG